MRHHQIWFQHISGFANAIFGSRIFWLPSSGVGTLDAIRIALPRTIHLMNDRSAKWAFDGLGNVSTATNNKVSMLEWIHYVLFSWIITYYVSSTIFSFKRIEPANFNVLDWCCYVRCHGIARLGQSSGLFVPRIMIFWLFRENCSCSCSYRHR